MLFQSKNILLLISIGFYIAAFLSYLSEETTSSLNIATSFDFYVYSTTQKKYFRYDVISFYLVAVYMIKYFQIFEQVHLLFVSLKKASFEFISIILAIGFLIVGLSLLTYFVYGGYVFEYRDFINSLTTNIKIFILMEDTNTSYQLLRYFRPLSVLIILVFLFLIRLFLMNLFYPILIEYFRLEYERNVLSQQLPQLEENPNYTFKQSKYK